MRLLLVESRNNFDDAAVLMEVLCGPHKLAMMMLDVIYRYCKEGWCCYAVSIGCYNTMACAMCRLWMMVVCCVDDVESE